MKVVPGSTIGMMGGGQLGRMSLMAARQLGYRSLVLEPGESCAASVADGHLKSDYNNAEALEQMARCCGVITYEFENLPVQATRLLEGRGSLVRPGSTALEICQNRLREKTFLRQNGFACAPFAVAGSLEELERGLQAIGFPCVVKTAGFGYDGKGQLKCMTPPESLTSLWKHFGHQTVVIERFIPFVMEVSVVLSRGVDGSMAVFPLAENLHRNHILHQTIVPARLEALDCCKRNSSLAEGIRRQAQATACAIAEKFAYVGVIGVEFFLLADGTLLVNEMAPRPHNSGHWSLDGSECSQFEQHIRAVCGLPLGNPEPRQPSVMVNLLGDVWHGGEPDWSGLLSLPGLHLHLYDKGQPRPQRKMGHFTVCAGTLEKALETAARGERLLGI